MTDRITWHALGRPWEAEVPGYIDDLPENAYHAAPGVSSSLIRAMRRSPAHYKSARDRKGSSDSTPAQKLGTLRHCLLFESDTFGDRYAVKPAGIDRRTKAGKEAWIDFEASCGWREIITEDELQAASVVVHAVRKWPRWDALAGTAPVAERSLFWRDKDTGLLCRCRADLLNLDEPGYAWNIDLKTTRDASPASFTSYAIRMGYHVQGAFYAEGIAAVLERKVDTVLVAAEYTPPFAVAGYAITGSMGITPAHALGLAHARAALLLIAQCEQLDEFPAYQDGLVAPLELPRWCAAEADAALVGQSDPF